MLRTSYCVLLIAIALCVIWMDMAAGYPVLGYAPTDDNDTAGLLESLKDATADEPSTYYINTMDKRFNGPQPRGPLDDCKSYFDCKSRFIKYLDGLSRMGKMG